MRRVDGSRGRFGGSRRKDTLGPGVGKRSALVVPASAAHEGLPDALAGAGAYRQGGEGRRPALVNQLNSCSGRGEGADGETRNDEKGVRGGVGLALPAREEEGSGVRDC